MFNITLNSGPNAGNTYIARIPYYLRGMYYSYVYSWATYTYGPYYGYYARYYWYGCMGRQVKVTGAVNGGYFDVTGMHAIYYRYSDSYINTIESPLDGGPSPSCFEYFKGHYYAGFYKNSDLLRVDAADPYSTVSDLGAWENCGTINDPDASPARPLNTSILTLGKTTSTDAFGTVTDLNLYIGGTARLQAANSYGTCPLYSTEGEDITGDPNTVPLDFTLEEDEWRYNKDQNSPNFQNRMFGIYDVYGSSLGLITQFGVNSIPPADVWDYRNNHAEYKHRHFMLYNAPPSCDITHDPDPIVNERGTYTSAVFTFTPTGGFGSGNVDVRLTLPENIYVPTEDAGGNPINQLYHSHSIPMNGGVLNLPITIKSTNSATVNTYRDNPDAMVHITDLTANITVDDFWL